MAASCMAGEAPDCRMGKESLVSIMHLILLKTDVLLNSGPSC